MKQIKNLIITLLMLTILSCSDGVQISQKVEELIKENKIETIVILKEAKNGQVQKEEITINKKTLDGQFIQHNGNYINMGTIKTMKVNGKKLELKI